MNWGAREEQTHRPAKELCIPIQRNARVPLKEISDDVPSSLSGVTLFEFIYLFFIRHPQERGTSELGIPFLLSRRTNAAH